MLNINSEILLLNLQRTNFQVTVSNAFPETMFNLFPGFQHQHHCPLGVWPVQISAQQDQENLQTVIFFGTQRHLRVPLIPVRLPARTISTSILYTGRAALVDHVKCLFPQSNPILNNYRCTSDRTYHISMWWTRTWWTRTWWISNTTFTFPPSLSPLFNTRTLLAHWV